MHSQQTGSLSLSRENRRKSQPGKMTHSRNITGIGRDITHSIKSLCNIKVRVIPFKKSTDRTLLYLFHLWFLFLSVNVFQILLFRQCASRTASIFITWLPTRVSVFLSAEILNHIHILIIVPRGKKCYDYNFLIHSASK